MTGLYYIPLAVALLVVWGGPAACGPEAASTDTRTPITVPIQGRDAVLSEMRAMLGSVSGILDAVSRADTAALRHAATASGMAAAADPSLARYLPEGFLKLGMNTHQQFDSLARVIPSGAWKDTVAAGLARLTTNCVSCHAMYRLEVR